MIKRIEQETEMGVEVTIEVLGLPKEIRINVAYKLLEKLCDRMGKDAETWMIQPNDLHHTDYSGTSHLRTKKCKSAAQAQRIIKSALQRIDEAVCQAIKSYEGRNAELDLLII